MAIVAVMVAKALPLLDLSTPETSRQTLPQFRAALQAVARVYGSVATSQALRFYRRRRLEAVKAVPELAGVTLPSFALPKVDIEALGTELDNALTEVTAANPPKPPRVSALIANDQPAAADTTLQDALQRKASAIVERHVLNAGSDTLIAAVAADPIAVRYGRVPEPDCCAFCAMLAIRGPVYTAEASAASASKRGVLRVLTTDTTANFRPHENCRCDVQPLFRGEDYKAPADLDHLTRIYTESTRRYDRTAHKKRPKNWRLAQYRQALEASRKPKD